MPEIHKGGMIALIPDEASADRLGAAGANAEAKEELHLTLTYLGGDVTSLPETQREGILAAARSRASVLPPVTARVFAHAVFNPDGHADREPCAVYLVSDSRELGPLREELSAYAAAEQHEPFIPHITAGYGVPIGDLTFTGPVTFDRIRVALGGDYHDFPLTGTSTKGSTVDEVKKVSQAERDRLAKGPRATGAGTYVIKDIGDLKNAISKYSKVSDEDEKKKLRKHIVSNAKRLKATNMLPKNWTETPAGEKKDGEYGWVDASDSFTAGVLLGLSGMDDAEAAELKAGPPGATFPSKDPRAKQLRDYWVRGAGAAKIRWGTGGDFDRCVRHMRKHVGTRAEGLCNVFHRSALGAAPGKGHKSLPEGVEQKSLTLWMVDPESPVGYRAHTAQWLHVADPALAAELKSAADMEAEFVRAQFEAKSAEPVDDEPADDSAAFSLFSEPEAKVTPASEDDVLSKLDQFEDVADKLTVEEVYEEALGSDLKWTATATGELEPEQPEQTAEPVVTAEPEQTANEDEQVSLFDDTEDDEGWGALPADAN